MIQLFHLMIYAIRRMRGGGVVRLERGARVLRGARLVARRRNDKIFLGSNSTIQPGAMLITNGGNISIGKGCSVHPYCVLYGTGGLTIGNNVRIATHSVIVPFNHNFDDTDIPIKEQGITKSGVVIEDDVWLGARSTILAGSHIKHGCVIAAGAVVIGTTVPFGVYAGVPAKLIKMRGRQLPEDAPMRSAIR